MGGPIIGPFSESDADDVEMTYLAAQFQLGTARERCTGACEIPRLPVYCFYTLPFVVPDQERLMKGIVFGILTTLTGLVQLFSYRTSLETVDPTGHQPVSRSTTSSNASGATVSGLAEGSFTGGASTTRFGPARVRLTATEGLIGDVHVISYPDSNGQDRQINQKAVPRLVSETVDAQSAHIDMVTGAPFASRGYISSLQSAIDQAPS